MTIENNYYINVTKANDGCRVHYCRIELGWCFEKDALAKFKELQSVFDGGIFDLTLHYVQCYSTEVKTGED